MRYFFSFLLLPLFIFTAACQAHDTPFNRQIATNGVGEIRVAPDQAVISVSAKATQKSSSDASSRVNEKVNALLASLKKLGINKEQVVAASLHLNPRYEHRPNTGRYFSGYEASRSVQITLHDLENIPPVLDLAIAAGIDHINGIRYQSSEEEKHLAKAHQLAIEDSKQKAASLAQAYDAELGVIITINYHNNRPALTSFKQEMGDRVFASRASASPAVYLPDELTFKDQIQVSFDLIIPE